MVTLQGSWAGGSEGEDRSHEGKAWSQGPRSQRPSIFIVTSTITASSVASFPPYLPPRLFCPHELLLSYLPLLHTSLPPHPPPPGLGHFWNCTQPGLCHPVPVQWIVPTQISELPIHSCYTSVCLRHRGRWRKLRTPAQACLFRCGWSRVQGRGGAGSWGPDSVCLDFSSSVWTPPGPRLLCYSLHVS